MKIGWGWRLTILYSGFVLLIGALVFASAKQHFDLVSNDYYEDEIAYQKVIDAGKNQSALSTPIQIHADRSNVTLNFPVEFKDKKITGEIQFYAPVNSEWDKSFKIEPQQNVLTLSREKLHDTRYTIKISFVVDGKSYYQESEILLHS